MRLWIAGLSILLFLIGLSACSGTERNDGDKTPPTAEETGHTEGQPDTEGKTGEAEQPISEKTVEETIAEVPEQVEATFDVKLPATIDVPEGESLAVKVLSDPLHYEVSFFKTHQPMEVNDPALSEEEPAIILKGTAYETVEEAQEQVGYQPIQEGMPEVELRSGIIGYQDAGAGSSFITWHEGRWSFVTRSRNDEAGNEKGLQLAKEIVGKLEQQTLPPPHENGAGTFDSVDSNSVEANRLAWQEENIMYEAYMADPLQLVELVAALE